MTESFCNIEDEAFPSFLSDSLCSGRGTLGNVTLASTLGIPVAASTVAKIRVGTDNRVNTIQASYLEDGRISLLNSQCSNEEQGNFALSFKDDLDDADDFIAAHRFSNRLVKVNMDETEPRVRGSILGPTTQPGPLSGRPSENGDDISAGMLTFTHLGKEEFMDLKALSLRSNTEASPASDEVDSDRFCGSVSSFLANEKLMSMDSMNSDVTDEDIDVDDLQNGELDQYFNKLVPPPMQRGRVEGQEIPGADQPANQDYSSEPSSTEPERNRYQFLDDFDPEDFQMLDVRLAATGMDSCPASDEEDTEDELESVRRHTTSARHRLMLPSTSRQLVGESHRPSFRPGLEGGSSDDEPYSARNLPATGIEHRRSAEGQVINSVAGDGGGGDGSSGSEEGGNDGGVSTLPLPSSSSSVQTTYDVLRGLGIVGGEEAQDPHSAPGLGMSRGSLMGDRVGPVGTGENVSGAQRMSPVNWSMSLDRQEALDAMDSTDSVDVAEGQGVLDSMYLRTGAGHWTSTTANLQTTQSSFQISQALSPHSDDEERGRPALGLRGGPCGDSSAPPPPPPGLSDGSQGEEDPLSTSLEAKYLSQTVQQEDSSPSDSDWNHCPDNLELEFQQGSAHSVVYQNEEGKWVTDLAYYSSFEKEVDGVKLPDEIADQFQAEEFVPATNAIEKIIEDQEVFEKEHQFMQEEVMEPASGSPGLLADTSWRLPASSHVLMRASQVSQEFDQGNQSYLRLSLGTFFQQRSEALGSLGANREDDMVKRPSFGYVITSPEKRDPFPLIRPSDFPSQESSVHNDTLTHTDADQTMNAEDLDKTLEAATDRVSPKGGDTPEPCGSDAGKQDPPVDTPLPEVASPSVTQPSATPGSLDTSPTYSTDQPDLMLSISTIASAIADASISSDPSQLAAMIMELSKRSRLKNRRQTGVPGQSTAGGQEEPAHSPTQVQLDQNTLLESLQRSCCAGDLSAFDIEKYLKQMEVSTSSDSDQSGSPHYTFDLHSLVDSLSFSHRKSLSTTLPVENGSLGYNKDQPPAIKQPSSAKGDDSSVEGKLGMALGNPAADCHRCPGQTGAPACPANKAEVRRSSIPRPRAGSIPSASGNLGRRSVGSGQSSAAKLAPVGKGAGGASGNGTGTNGPKVGAVRPSPNPSPALGGSSRRDPASAPGPKTSPSPRKGVSGLPALRGPTPPSQRAKSTGCNTNTSRTTQQDKASPPEKCLGSAPRGTVEKHVVFTSACHSPLPATAHRTYDAFPGTPVQHTGQDQTQMTFRPSTSPLTHSSPSQTSFPSQDGTAASPSSRMAASPTSSGGVGATAPNGLSPPCSRFHSESGCSSPSLSRLTYVSLNDCSAFDSTGIPTPDRHKSNATLGLSTTIIRASPTPPVDQGDGQHQTGRDLPHKPSGDTLCPPIGLSSPHHRPQSPEPHRSNANSQPTDGPGGLGCVRSQSECDFHCGGNRDHSQRKRQSEPGSHRLASVDSGYFSNLNIQQPGAVGSRGNQPWSGVSEVHAGAGTGFGLPPSYSSEDMRYVPISSFRPQGPVGELPSGVPALLTGNSLFSSQLAQQYLGPDRPLHSGPPLPYGPCRHMAAAGNGLYGHTVPSGSGPNTDLALRHLNSAGGLGQCAPGGHGGLYQGQFHQNPGPLYQNQGLLQGSNLQQNTLDPGYRSQTPLEPGLMGGKPYTQPSMGSWANSDLPDLRAQVVVPDEIRFPHACCVGIASQTSLGIFNPSERWQQVSISVSSLAIDGERVESFPYQWLIVKNKTIIGPKSTEEQKVLFIPPQAGVYQAVLSVSSWPASAEAEVVARAEVFAKRVVLVAVAESPALEVDAGTCGSLDFGDLVGGSAKALPLKVLNRTHATLPIRLVISANAMAWRCFTFSKSPVAQTAEGLLHAGTVTSLAAPSVMNHVMHASYGENPDSFMVWVHFHAPQKYQSSSGDLGPAEEYSARVDIEVDCPGPSHVISSVPLRARSGTARVHAPKDLQTVSLSAPLGKSNTLTLPLKNAGNIAVQLKLKSSSNDDSFSVRPEELSLAAGEERGIVVLFTAQGSRKNRESVLTILVQPSGPQYEVVLRGEVLTEDGGKPDPPGPASVLGMLPHSEVPPILSNKQFMAWGGVTLGRAVQQKLVLRNNSPNTTHQLRLLIRGQDQNCFQLQSCFGSEQRLARHRELSIRPKEDVTVHLLFAPTRVACTLAKLEIKQSGVRPSQPGIKFTIPLSGYGGTSNVVLEDQRKRSDGYVATLAGISAGRVSKLCVCVRNTGSRAAFIKAVAYSDLMTRAVMDSSVISLSPSQFVLKERTQEVITVLVKVSQREETLCRSADAILATVCLFCGDEVSRQQFRKWLQSKPEAGRKVVSENSLLKGLDFNETFLGEELVLEAYDLPQSPNQALLFYGSLSKVVLSVLGSTEASDSGERDPLAVTRRGSEADSGFGTSDRHISNVSLDVLPVKGPQGPVLPRTSGPQVGTGTRDNSDTWTLQPEHVVLMAPSISGASNTRHVQIQNTTSRELSFELSWPAHCLTVTPQHGLIEPECHLQILISPNPSLAARPSMLPWSGQIYVQCDGQQKFIKVQIRQDLTLDVSAAPADRSLAPLPAQAATPVMPPAARASQHQARPGPAQVEISNRTVVFPATPSGDSSESFLEVENGPEEVRWYLSSFAPPYVKGVDSSGHVYRATYTAFRCSRVSGTLGAHEKMQVPVTFLPRDRGDYAQFWDLECHPVVEPQNKNRIRFQLCGVGVKAGPVEAHQEGDCSLVKTEAIVRTRKGPEMTAAASRGETCLEEAVRRGVYTPQDAYTFPPTRVRETSTLKVNVRNNSFETHELMFLTPREPFHIKHSKYSLRSQRYIHLPVQFKPAIPGSHSSLLLVQTGTSGSLTIQLTGEALP